MSNVQRARARFYSVVLVFLLLQGIGEAGADLNAPAASATLLDGGPPLDAARTGRLRALWKQKGGKGVAEVDGPAAYEPISCPRPSPTGIRASFGAASSSPDADDPGPWTGCITDDYGQSPGHGCANPGLAAPNPGAAAPACPNPNQSTEYTLRGNTPLSQPDAEGWVQVRDSTLQQKFVDIQVEAKGPPLEVVRAYDSEWWRANEDTEVFPTVFG